MGRISIKEEQDNLDSPGYISMIIHLLRKSNIIYSLHIMGLMVSVLQNNTDKTPTKVSVTEMGQLKSNRRTIMKLQNKTACIILMI